MTMVKYGLTIENQNKIIDLAKTKNDGVYSFRGVEYKVRDHKVTHYAAGGQVLEAYGHFNVVVGNYDGYPSSARKLLKNA